jgi:hypothetical protein
MMTEMTTRLLLVRSGGRCALCFRDLMTSPTTFKDLYLGERAHIVGRSTSPGSPRGDDALPVEERDEVDNLMLLCGTCHDDADDKINLGVLTVGLLRKRKARHERHVAEVLSIRPNSATSVLRMTGLIGAAGVGISRSTAATSVLTSGRVATFPWAQHSDGCEVDLGGIPDPEPANRNYYETGARKIDRFFDRQFTPAVEDGTVRHLSVFALTRWPLLVLLGAKIGDKIETDVYQRHRTFEGWDWPPDGNDTQFDWAKTPGTDTDDAVLVLSLSATVRAREAPDDLQGLLTYRVAPTSGVTPDYHVIGTPAALKSAEAAFRAVLADIERHAKHVRRVHVIGAAPQSACIALGRSLTLGVHPQLVLYDRIDGTYRPALEVN